MASYAAVDCASNALASTLSSEKFFQLWLSDLCARSAMTARGFAQLVFAAWLLAAARMPAGCCIWLECEQGGPQGCALWRGYRAPVHCCAALAVAHACQVARAAVRPTARNAAGRRGKRPGSAPDGDRAVGLAGRSNLEHRWPPPDAASAAKRLHERAAPWLCEKGEITWGLAREVSLCRTARRVHGMHEGPRASLARRGSGGAVGF